MLSRYHEKSLRRGANIRRTLIDFPELQASSLNTRLDPGEKIFTIGSTLMIATGMLSVVFCGSADAMHQAGANRIALSRA
jgi:hypothetical protein